MSLYNSYRKRSFYPDVAIPAKYLLGKTGTVQSNINLVTAQADKPNCILQDSTLRAGTNDLTQPIKVIPLTGNPELAWAAAGGVINDGDDVVSLGNGTIGSLQASTTASGTYWKVGVCFGDSCIGSSTITDTALDGVQFTPENPSQVTK